MKISFDNRKQTTNIKCSLYTIYFNIKKIKDAINDNWNYYTTNSELIINDLSLFFYSNFWFSFILFFHTDFYTLWLHFNIEKFKIFYNKLLALKRRNQFLYYCINMIACPICCDAVI